MLNTEDRVGPESLLTQGFCLRRMVPTSRVHISSPFHKVLGIIHDMWNSLSIEIEGSFDGIQDQPFQALLDEHVGRSYLDVAGKSRMTKLSEDTQTYPVTPNEWYVRFMGENWELWSNFVLLPAQKALRWTSSVPYYANFLTLCREIMTLIPCSFLLVCDGPFLNEKP